MILLLILFLQLNDASGIDLGGPRNAKVAIKQSADSFDLIVSLIPVSCFDETVNRRLTIEKSKYYARLAMVRYLQVDSNKTLSFGRSKVSSESSQGNLRIIRWEVADVRVSDRDRLPTRHFETIEPNSESLLNAKTEYQLTISQLAADIKSETPIYEGSLLTFYRNVANFEEQSMVLFETLRKDIADEELLLRIEKEELLRAVDIQESRFQAQLLRQTEVVESGLAKPE